MLSVGSLVFNDDFNQPVGALPSTSTWTYNTGVDPNNAAVHYVDDASTLSVVNDASASDGKALAMTIYPTSAGNTTLNSARINTSGNSAGNVEYGLVEARIKLPGGPNGQGDGLWPAFWMLGSDHTKGVGWPNCGEIDVMEQGAQGPSTNVGSTHFGSLSGASRQDTSSAYKLPAGQAFYSNYHTFAVYWTPGSISFSVDGNVYSTIKRSSYSASLWDQTFQQPFYLILNICDGGPNNAGGFPGPTTKDSTFPQTMYVDYVRAYSLTGISTPSNVAASLTNATTVNVTWDDPADDETGFVLQRSKTADFATIDASFSLPQGVKTFQDSTAAPGTTYFYRLQAVATDGTHNYQSTYSAATSISTPSVNASADLALNRPAFASSTENGTFPAGNAVDGNSATRWSSQFADPQWIYVDLGANFNIKEVRLNWEAAAGKNYQIQVSADAKSWTTISTITGNATAGVHDYTGLAGAGRYVRIYGTARTTPYGYSLYDFSVFGAAAPAVAQNSFVLTNQTGQQVNFALYGLDNTSGQWSYFSGSASGNNNFSGSLVAVQQLGAGHQLPTYSFTGSLATLNLPAMPAGITSAALVLTVGDRSPSITVAPDFSVPRPAPSNPTLVNATTNPYYDFIEFTLDGNNTFYINTTQVDQFGFPITLSSNPQAPGSPAGVTPGITREAIFQAFSAFLNKSTDPAARDYLPLIQTASAGSPYRIIAPGQYLAMPGKGSDPLNHYFDTALKNFYAAPPPLKLTALNPFSNSDPATYTFVGTAAVHNPVASGDLVNGAPDTNPNDNHNFAVIDFVGQAGSGSLTGAHFYIYSPINAPSWIGGSSAGEQVFANNGVFADNAPRFGNSLKSIVLGNLENQVVSALTRGVADITTPSTYANTTAFWTDSTQAFPDGQKANLYAKFLHTGTIGGKSIFIGGRVYAFPYSDQGNQAAFFAVHDPQSISITLDPWNNPPVSPTFASTLYLRSAGALATQPGTAAQAETIASAAGTNRDGVPTNALVDQIKGLTATYDPSKQTQFTLYLDAGTQVANGTQVRISYDFTGDGVYDRVETYRYFAEDNRTGWEAYTQAVGLRDATGTFANLVNGSVKVEVWNAIGQAPVSLRVDASASDGLQSQIAIPFAAATPNPVPTLKGLSTSSAPAGSASTAVTLTGTNFNGTSTVLWNGTPLVTTRLSATQLAVTIPAANLALAGVASVAVTNPAPGGGTSGALPFTVTAPPTAPIGNTLYLLRPSTSSSAGTLSAQAGSGAQVNTIASAGGINRDGTPTNALVFLNSGLTGTYDPTKQTRFALFVDAGNQLANGTQIRVSYDFNGDGVYVRVETYRYFAEDNRAGWEAYTQAAGLLGATGAFANLVNGSVKVEIWNAIGSYNVLLRTDATNTEGAQSSLAIPFLSLREQKSGS